MRNFLKWILGILIFLIIIYVNYIFANFLAIKLGINDEIKPLTVISLYRNGTDFLFGIFIIIEIIVSIKIAMKIEQKKH